ncbi:ABC transporter ATP-binding protein [Nitratireductor aquimarinus]|uniref:ABC transporter ATP-binding protein n=1 Tax=Nitratireductor aquimarinus TaxID=889300 RepID=UPI001A8F50D0|nr:ABC transporter ATP-binding protein [Nitratireductor aquimarinus]MBN8243103.1 ABC transporter ATP-binding protein [Nitratireductor aquimarinus]MBY6131004.1 ABC transporter ATP-binding protein [Nitratireductor aquimarinus]MCA1302240.1 ABC transporter ATP-binding protein [Nitratireductor aquimarinus]
MSTPVLSVENLHVAFGNHAAVKDLSFSIAARETVALVGESGSGKSATALSIMRLIEREGGRITSGAIRLMGDEPTDIAALSDNAMRALRGRQVSMVFQEPMTSLNPVLTIGEQICEVFIRHNKMSRLAATQAATEALDKVRIPEPARRLKQYPHELSGGLRQRVMIAMALACRPRLLIADEPTTALDVTTQAEILSLIRQLQEEIGMAVLFITHDMGVVAEIADRVVVMRHGVKEEEAGVEDLFDRPQAAYSRQLMEATPRLGAGAPRLQGVRNTILEVNGLTTRFAGKRSILGQSGKAFTAVNNASLTLRAGETLGLVGESGCGKSTLARSILRLVEPVEGTVRIAGHDMMQLDRQGLRAARRDAQMVFQDPYASLNPRLPVHELITEPARIHGMVRPSDCRDMAVSLVERVGLEADAVDRFPHQFSGGQRQRLCIARALSVKPRLIVADEAVSALDVSIARQVTDLMLDLQRSDGLAFLFISHDIAVVERVSHRVAVMLAGEIVETGLTDDVLSNPQHAYTKRLLSAVPRADPSLRKNRRTASDTGSLLPADNLPMAVQRGDMSAQREMA